MIEFPDAPGLRPTPDRVRETLFNWLGQTLFGKTCLDLFAGSGALGFEAASREAESVHLVERNPQVFRTLRRTAEVLQFANVTLHAGDGLEFARSTSLRFDVIFLDPPFQSELLGQALACVDRCLAEGGQVYVESANALERFPRWQMIKRGRAGSVHYHLLERNAESHLSGDL